MRQKVPISADVTLGNGRELRVAVLDINENGALIHTSPPQKLNPNVKLALAVAGLDDSVHATGVVVWSDNSGQAGICFSNLHCGASKSLEEWLSRNFLAALNSLPRPIACFASASTQAVSSEPSSTTTFRREAPVEAVKPGISTSLQPIVEGALRLTHSTGAAIAWGHGEEIVCVATAGSSAPPLGAQLQAGSGFSGECIRTARTLRCDDCEVDDRVNREGCRVLGIRSMVAVPIVSGNQIYGLLEVFAPEPNHFSSQDEHILEKFAEIIAFPSTDSSGTIVTSDQLKAERLPDLPVEGVIIEGNAKDVPASSNFPGLRYEPPFAHLSSRRSTKAITAVAALALGAVVWLSWSWIQSARGGLPPAGSQSQWRASGAELNPYNDSFSIPLNASDLSGLRARAEQGDANAQFALGKRYAIGQGTTQDYGQAVLWLSRAAEQGHVTAQSFLSSYYESGIGVPQDLAKAYFWAAVAAAGGDRASEDRIASLNSRMSRTQVLDAQEQFGVWLRQHSAGARPAIP